MLVLFSKKSHLKLKQLLLVTPVQLINSIQILADLTKQGDAFHKFPLESQ